MKEFYLFRTKTLKQNLAFYLLPGSYYTNKYTHFQRDWKMSELLDSEQKKKSSHIKQRVLKNIIREIKHYKIPVVSFVKKKFRPKATSCKWPLVTQWRIWAHSN